MAKKFVLAYGFFLVATGIFGSLIVYTLFVVGPTNIIPFVKAWAVVILIGILTEVVRRHIPSVFGTGERD